MSTNPPTTEGAAQGEEEIATMDPASPPRAAVAAAHNPELTTQSQRFTPPRHERNPTVTEVASILEKIAAASPTPTNPSSQQPMEVVTLEDVVGGNVSSPPAELESETRVLKAVEGIDLNDGMQDIGEETSQVFQNIVAAELASRASADDTHDDEEPNSNFDPELEPLSSIRTGNSALLTAVTGQSKMKKKTHRHTMSIEETLFGLTTTFAEMKTQVSQGSDTDPSTQSLGIYDASTDPLTKAATILTEHAQEEIEERKDDIEAQAPESAPNTTTATTTTNKDGEIDNNKDHNEDDQTDLDTSSKYRQGFLKFGAQVHDEMDAQYQVFNEFWGQRKAKAKLYLARLFMYIVIPFLGVAAILHYPVGNPIASGSAGVPVRKNLTTGETVYDQNGNIVYDGDVSRYASVSWWLIFVGVRQPLMLTLAFATQAVIIDFLVLRTRFLMKYIGALGTLFFVQAKGWPFVAVCWSSWNFLFLWGNHKFAQHWLFFQHRITLFNEENPAGVVLSSRINTQILVVMLIVGGGVAVKRVLVSVSLGRQAFAHFGESLADNMKNMVLIGSVAALARSIEKTQANRSSGLNGKAKGRRSTEAWKNLVAASALEEPESQTFSPSAVDAAKTFIEKHTTVNNQSTTKPDAEFSRSEQIKIDELLDKWEEGARAEEKTVKHISIGSVLQFRQAVTMMNATYPFTSAFGLANTREACIESAQRVYQRLLLRTPGEAVLPFETLALLAKDNDDDLDEETAKLLIKVFRPDRDGKLTLLDFVKSIDAVYKSCKLLGANIQNSRHTDAAVESIVNTMFWFFVGTFVLQQFGIDPWALLLSLSSVIIALSFAFGGSAARYVEGVIFILAQRPYGVGDRVHFSRPDTETSIDGSSGWIVERLSLTTTSLYWGATNERATIANGALAAFRVINSARSPNAQIYVNLKFAVDTTYDKLETFKAATQQYLKDRPREWLAFNGFRPTEVAVDRGFINYMIIAQHRCSWQEIGPILGSKAELVKFCMEVSRALDMRYMSPPLPVDLTIRGSRALPPGEIGPQEMLNMASS